MSVATKIEVPPKGLDFNDYKRVENCREHPLIKPEGAEDGRKVECKSGGCIVRLKNGYCSDGSVCGGY